MRGRDIGQAELASPASGPLPSSLHRRARGALARGARSRLAGAPARRSADAIGRPRLRTAAASLRGRAPISPQLRGPSRSPPLQRARHRRTKSRRTVRSSTRRTAHSMRRTHRPACCRRRDQSLPSTVARTTDSPSMTTAIAIVNGGLTETLTTNDAMRLRHDRKRLWQQQGRHGPRTPPDPRGDAAPQLVTPSGGKRGCS